MPIDGLIAFAGSEAGAQIFGEGTAKNVLAHAEEVKAFGAKYCDCAACAACEAVLEKKDGVCKIICVNHHRLFDTPTFCIMHNGFDNTVISWKKLVEKI